jgi:hypothetical protein
VKKILFIGGSNNQTTMMHEISKHMDGYDCYFTPYYCDGPLRLLYNLRLLSFTVMGHHHQKNAIEYIQRNNLKLDFEGKKHDYDLVVTSSDLIIQKNIRAKRIIHVQEGMTDPENFMYHIVRLLKLPRYLASTATAGLSHSYEMFCVASEGYREHFLRKGVAPERIVVTGIPNFDCAVQYVKNDFPYRNYVLAATSDARETFKYENRKKFIEKCLEIAGGRELIFKLHPNENFKRAIREIEKYAPGSKVFTSGNTNHMVANCDILVTKYSSVVFVGIALGKEVHSDFDLRTLRSMAPIQNHGTSGANIADVCRRIIENHEVSSSELSEKYLSSRIEFAEYETALNTV